MPMSMGSYNKFNTLVYLGEETITKENLNSTHLKFCCPAMQTPSVIVIMFQTLTVRFKESEILLAEGVRSAPTGDARWVCGSAVATHGMRALHSKGRGRCEWRREARVVGVGMGGSNQYEVGPGGDGCRDQALWRGRIEQNGKVA